MSPDPGPPVTPRGGAWAAGWRIGVDLGGTKIEVAALDADGAPRWRRRVPTPRNDYHATVAAIVALVGDAEAALGVRASVGVGVDRDRADAQVAAGAEDAHGDLAAVGDKQGLDTLRYSTSVAHRHHIRKMP